MVRSLNISGSVIAKSCLTLSFEGLLVCNNCVTNYRLYTARPTHNTYN